MCKCMCLTRTGLMHFLCMVRVYDVHGVCVLKCAFVCLCVCGGGVRLGVCVCVCVFLRVCARACVYMCVWSRLCWDVICGCGCVDMSGAYGADVYGVHESIRVEPYCSHGRCYVYWQYCQYDAGMCTYI